MGKAISTRDMSIVQGLPSNSEGKPGNSNYSSMRPEVTRTRERI